MKINFDELRAPFREKEILWRVGRSGITGSGQPWIMPLAYVDARSIQERLDSVLGPENWTDYYEIKDSGILCRISIKIGDSWVCKMNGSPETKVEAFKGGISKAFVRTASNWGIGRYLYDLDQQFADIPHHQTKGCGIYRDKIQNNYYYWNPPKLPKWALPEA